MNADYGRRWRYEIRAGDETVEECELGDDKEALEWAASRLRDHGLQEATVHRAGDSGIDSLVGTVRRARRA